MRLGSDRSMQRQVLSQYNAVCLHVQHRVFDAQVPKRSRTRACSRRYKRGPIQGQESVRDFRAIPFAIMRCMGIPCKKIHIAFLTLRQPLAPARMPACLILIHWLRNLVRKRENSSRTSDLSRRLDIWLTSKNYMFLFVK